jgi:alpha-ribazole phosphatase
MRLWLVRHPRPDVPAGLCYGASDVPIVETHLEELLASLPARLPRGVALYSSPLSRCLRLARGLEHHGWGPAVTDPRLREMDFGHWEGRSWSDVPRAQIDAWRDDLECYVPPGGEPLAALAHRCGEFVAGLPEGHRAIVVTHAVGVRRAAHRLRPGRRGVPGRRRWLDGAAGLSAARQST